MEKFSGLPDDVKYIIRDFALKPHPNAKLLKDFEKEFEDNRLKHQRLGRRAHWHYLAPSYKALSVFLRNVRLRRIYEGDMSLGMYPSSLAVPYSGMYPTHHPCN